MTVKSLKTVIAENYTKYKGILKLEPWATAHVTHTELALCKTWPVIPPLVCLCVSVVILIGKNITHCPHLSGLAVLMLWHSRSPFSPPLGVYYCASIPSWMSFHNFPSPITCLLLRKPFCYKGSFNYAFICSSPSTTREYLSQIIITMYMPVPTLRTLLTQPKSYSPTLDLLCANTDNFFCPSFTWSPSPGQTLIIVKVYLPPKLYQILWTWTLFTVSL